MRYHVVPVLLFHLWAMWPDLAFRAGVPHDHWMDWVALGHVSSHYLPGGDTAWLVIALTATGAYALLLSRWLARHRTPEAPGQDGPSVRRPGQRAGAAGRSRSVWTRWLK